ncbi:MAG: DEAD/DEAH box helicase [Hyphomicrobiaceae bacterium]
MTEFSTLGLAAPLVETLTREGYTVPTPIQTQAIPSVLAGADVLGIAQTGTGKTAAFALPILQRLANDRRPAPRKGCRVLVLSPTRELATQIADSFRRYGRSFDLRVATVFGGVGHGPQIQALSRGVDVLVATPGRLLDHIGARAAVLSGTEILVLDEVDQMLDLGFVKPIRRIVGEIGARRQNLFFSATLPREIAALADEFLRNPVKVSVTPVSTTAERVSQRIVHVEANRKRALLAELLADAAMSRTLVFTRTKRGADRVAKYLDERGISVAAIHGNKSQNQRQNALESFRKAKIRVLVATDIAARGIDVDLVTHVINFELPEVPEAYVHRIGRTARAGASGIAISLCDREERELLRAIERLTRQAIPAEDRHGDATLEADLAKHGGGPRSPGRGQTVRAPKSTRARPQRRPDRNGRGEGDRASSETPARAAHEPRPRHGSGRPDAERLQSNRDHRDRAHAARRPRDRSRDANVDEAGRASGIGEVAFLAKPPSHPNNRGARPGAHPRSRAERGRVKSAAKKM